MRGGWLAFCQRLEGERLDFEAAHKLRAEVDTGRLDLRLEEPRWTMNSWESEA